MSVEASSGFSAAVPDSSFGPLRQIDAGLLNVGYVDIGPAEGPVVVLLHGWPYDMPMAPPPADAPGPFSLSDPDRVRDLLHGAGWSDVNFTAKDELLCFGPDANTATTFIVGQMKWLFEKLDDVGKRQAEANLHDVMAAPAGEDGVLLGSGAWIVTARR
jgi:pimeloyl-ACP methyl ester carboxylesterase